jgi:hypothetical protein
LPIGFFESAAGLSYGHGEHLFEGVFDAGAVDEESVVEFGDLFLGDVLVAQTALVEFVGF